MSAEDLDNYETDAELALYREYRDVIKLFTYGALKALLHMVCVHAAFSISRKQTRHTMARLRV